MQSVFKDGFLDESISGVLVQKRRDGRVEPPQHLCSQCTHTVDTPAHRKKRT